MRPLFVNRYTPTIKMFEHFYQKTSQRYSRIVGCVGLFLLAFAGVILYAFGGFTIWIILLILLGVTLCLALLFFHRIMAGSAYRHTLKMHGGKVLRTVVNFTDEEITVTEGDYFLALDYKDMVKIVDCDTLYALMFGPANGIMVKKDGFFVGEPRSFLPFLEKKTGMTIKQKSPSPADRDKRRGSGGIKG